MKSSMRWDGADGWERAREQTRAVPSGMSSVAGDTFVLADDSMGCALRGASSVRPTRASSTVLSAAGTRVAASPLTMSTVPVLPPPSPLTSASRVLVVPGSGARRLSYYDGFLGDVLSRDERTAPARPTAHALEASASHRPATPVARLASSGRRSRHGSQCQHSVPHTPLPGGSSSAMTTASSMDKGEAANDTSHSFITHSLVSPLLTRSGSAARRRTSASVVDPLDVKGMDASEVRPRRSLFDAQLAEAMVNTAQRMSLSETSGSSRRRSSSRSSRSNKSRNASLASHGTSTVTNTQRMTSQSTGTVRAWCGEEWLPHGDGSGVGLLAEAVGWDAQGDPPAVTSSNFASSARAFAQRPSSGRVDLSADTPELSHKQLTEAFYGRYKGGVMAKDAYLYFLASQAEQKRALRKGQQREAEGRLDTHVMARTQARPASSSTMLVRVHEPRRASAPASAGETNTLVRDPSAAFDAMGLPSVASFAAFPGPTSTSGEALPSRLRGMSLQSNQSWSPAPVPLAGQLAEEGLRKHTVASSPIAGATATGVNGSGSYIQRSLSDGDDREGSGYYQFLRIHNTPDASEGVRGAADARYARVESTQGCLAARIGTSTEGGRAPPSTHVQELLRQSQAIYGAKQLAH